jgi:hypothetical protein
VLLPLQYLCDADALSAASELLELNKTLEAISQGESPSLTNTLTARASSLHELLEGLDVSSLYSGVTAI